MFDQSQLDQNQFSGGVNPQPAPVAPLPEPVQPAPMEQPQYVAAPAPLEDMFGSAAEAPVPGGYVPPQYAQPNSFQPYGQMPSAVNYADLMGGRTMNWGKILAIVAGLIILFGAIGVGVWIYLSSQSQVQPATEGNQQNEEQAATNTAPAVVATTTQQLSTNTIPIIPANTATATQPATSEKDSDGDGLTDAEEQVLGTNISDADTDHDGLTDWAEVKIYHTNPLNPDTDGDGYKDGEEVINGYDPNKAGGAKLFEVPKAGAAATTTK